MPRSAPHTPILLVEPNSTWRTLLARSLPGQVDAHARFETARRCMDVMRYDLIVANLRLGAYNGLHLVYAARTAGAATRAIVYDDHPNVAVARDVHRASALYELKHRLPITLPTYVGAILPAGDRRDPVVPDRRGVVRGGRRRWDRHVLAVGAAPAGLMRMGDRSDDARPVAVPLPNSYPDHGRPARIPRHHGSSATSDPWSVIRTFARAQLDRGTDQNDRGEATKHARLTDAIAKYGWSRRSAG